tara:strand:- start:661 stop:1089 length:429 start_codon:yes stop_codon:yes gene_type:complete
MSSVSRSALLPYPVTLVYGVVLDIENYSEFLPWCIRSEILDQTQHSQIASLTFKIKGITYTLVTKNTFESDEHISLDMVSGPVPEFSGQWLFNDLGRDVGCRVEFAASYQLSGIKALFPKQLIGSAATRVVDAFVARCAELL